MKKLFPNNQMRVLVCGGRDYNDFVTVYDTLDDLYDQKPITHLIAGEASGADHWAKSWAWMHRAKVKYFGFKADWDGQGKSAGPIRNQKMLDEGRPDLVVAFPGGVGTANMISKARKAGVKIVKVKGPSRY